MKEDNDKQNRDTQIGVNEGQHKKKEKRIIFQAVHFHLKIFLILHSPFTQLSNPLAIIMCFKENSFAAVVVWCLLVQQFDMERNQ